LASGRQWDRQPHQKNKASDGTLQEREVKDKGEIDRYREGKKDKAKRQETTGMPVKEKKLNPNPYSSGVRKHTEGKGPITRKRKRQHHP